MAITILIFSCVLVLLIFVEIGRGKKRRKEKVYSSSELQNDVVQNKGQAVQINYNLISEEGTASVKKIKHEKQQPKPVQLQEVEEVEDTEPETDIIPDFSDEDEVKKAIVSYEILNRKYE